MNIPLYKLNYTFSKKPLVIGGKAMEYYGLRKSGDDIDLVVTEADLIRLIEQYPDRVKDLWGDLGVCPYEFEIWKTICFFSYEDLLEEAIEQEECFIVSLEKLLFLKSLASKLDKNIQDSKLLVQEIINRQYKKYDDIKSQNEEIISEVGSITYIEKTGPENNSL